MRIRSIKLGNIKKFGKEQIYDFDIAEKVNTISGKNGSGKSTIFECAMLCQKAYFATLLDEKEMDFNNAIIDEISSQLYGMSVKKKAYIELVLRFFEADFHGKTNVEKYVCSDIENRMNAFDVRLLLKVDNIIQEKAILFDVIDVKADTKKDNNGKDRDIAKVTRIQFFYM